MKFTRHDLVVFCIIFLFLFPFLPETNIDLIYWENNPNILRKKHKFIDFYFENFRD